MKGRCIDPGAALALELNKPYYLFENGHLHYYVSKFDNPGAHFGCYQAKYFDVMEDNRTAFIIPAELLGEGLQKKWPPLIDSPKLMPMLPCSLENMPGYKEQPGTIEGDKIIYYPSNPDLEAVCMDWPQEPAAAPNDLEQGKLYMAQLIWRRPGYKQTRLQEYHIRANKTHAYFYHNGDLSKCGGCYPLHWFQGFIEIQEPDQEPPEIVRNTQETVHEPELFERGNGQLSFF